MNEEQYRSLCAACDQVLAEPDSPVERIAIPWLHVLSEHPAVLRHYAAIFQNSASASPVRLKSALSQIAGVAGDVGSGAARPRPQERAEVMFVSHLLNAGQIAGREDFYFGRLPEDLRKDGMSSCVVLINHAGVGRGRDTEWAVDMAPRRVLNRRLSLREELSLRRRLGREARRLRCSGARHRALQHRVYLEAARQALSGASLDTLRIYEQLRTLLAIVRPNVIVATYEGHAWERLLFAAARQILPDCRCIGYHHTILFPRQHAALRLLGPRYDPDVVLTAGNVARDRFRGAVAATNIRVSTLGTHRRSTGGIGAVTHERSSGRPPACLVLPDGIMSEVRYLFDFAVATAALMPQVRFILRLHPLISGSTLRRRFPRYRELPLNVELSDQSLSDDFSRSRWALYRGSGAAVQAVIAGVRPLYLEKPGELIIDCLSGLQAWKRIVTDPNEFVEIARSDPREDALGTNHEAAAAREYCEQYFMPADHRVLVQAIGDGRLSS